MLRFLTAGESHGPCLTGIIEGLVSGVNVNVENINAELRLRKKTWGRGERAVLEEDRLEILSGVVDGKTIGSPIGMSIKNFEKKLEHNSIPRPGHADLSGVLKYGLKNIHLIAERASARETAMRVAIGSLARSLVSEFGIELFSHTIEIGGVEMDEPIMDFDKDDISARNESELFCLDDKATLLMKDRIIEAKNNGDTLGGISEVLIKGIPPGIGSFVHYDRRLDFRMAGAMMSIPSVKGFELGDAVYGSRMPGSQVHDSISYNKKFFRTTNHAGGIEGGISNGETIRIRLYVKPIPTMKNPLPSVDINTKKAVKAPFVRSDVCVVPSVGIIGEAMAAWEIAVCFLEKFGGDTLGEVKESFNSYLDRLKEF